MDNNQNQEGLDGLPLEPWMNRQHLSSVHPALSAQVFNQHMSAQPMHDFLSHRSLQTFSTVDPTPYIIEDNSKTVCSSPALQQYSLSSSSARLQPEQLSLSHERSAWSHLLALDPTKTTPMGSRMPDPQVHCLAQDTPPLQNTRQEQGLMLKGDTKLPSFDNRSLNLPKLNFSRVSNSTASIPHDNYSHLSAVKSPQHKMAQQFNQPMNFSKTTYASKPATPQTLAISTDVSSLESSGSYSPVSPPATGVDVDEPNISNSGPNVGRAADLFLREPHEMSSATFPLFSASDHADFLNYLSGKGDAFPSDINMQDSYSESAKSFTESGLFSSPSEVPLDMTTAFSSKETSQVIAGVAFSSDSIINGKSSLTETLMTKDNVHLKDSVSEVNTTAPTTDRNQTQFILPMTCDDKNTKLVKSTPKKSNFYGRDASLFSFMPSSSYIGDTPASEYQSSDMVRTDTIENKSVCNSTNEAPSESLSIPGHEKVSSTAVGNTVVTSNMNVVDVSILSHDEPAMLPPDSVANVSTGSPNLQILESNTSDTWIDDSLGKSCDSQETLVTKNNGIQTTDNSEDNDLAQDNSKDVFSSNDDTVIGDADNTEKENSEESTDNWSQNVDIQEQVNEDYPTVPLTIKPKTTKRKKRKASGFQTRPRKKPVRKQLQVHLPVVFDNDGLNMEVNHSNTDMDVQGPEISEVQNDEQISYSNEKVAVKRKTRRVSTAKTSVADLAPRRSSSRKSKDNAMRLIELQADSNYSGISEPAPVVEKKATRKRKNSKLSSSLISGNDFSDGESTEEYLSDENDGDYVFDEDETEGFDNDEIVEHSAVKKIKEKKLGGLKISIKLSGNSSAEIVSGIDDSPATKKRKTAKKKNQKTKSKNKVKTIKEYDEAEVIQESLNSSGTGEDVEEAVNSVGGDKAEDALNSSDAKDRQMTLMEKYFLTASTATAARQTQKKTVSGKESAAQKKNAKSAKSKPGKNLASKSGTSSAKKPNEQSKEIQQKTSVKSGVESTVQNNKSEKGGTTDDTEIGVAKFVCGYCPQRYHNKQELLAHMEAHMVEMEKTSDTEVNENKKAQSVPPNLAVSRDPRSNRSGNAELVTVKPPVAENTAEKVKVKPAGDLVKESKDSNVKSVQDSLKQKLKCGECGEVFDSKPNLLEHVRIHTADKPFECDICHKCFTERNLLSVHRKTHGQEKLLRCHMCSKAFVDKTDLNLHMQSHPRRSNTKTVDKQMPPIKKSLKKSLQDKQDYEDPFVSKKPKSFASALSGEMDSSDKTNTSSSVLVTAKGDGPGAEMKNSSSSGSQKPILTEPKVSLKPVTSNIYKPAVVKTISYTKKPVEIPAANSNIKGDGGRMDGKKSNDVTTSSEGGKTETVSPNVCTCKECPDCVTRFLQSFE